MITLVVRYGCLSDIVNARAFNLDIRISSYVIGANSLHTSVAPAVGARLAREGLTCSENLTISEFPKRHCAILLTAMSDGNFFFLQNHEPFKRPSGKC